MNCPLTLVRARAIHIDKARVSQQSSAASSHVTSQREQLVIQREDACSICGELGHLLVGDLCARPGHHLKTNVTGGTGPGRGYQVVTSCDTFD